MKSALRWGSFVVVCVVAGFYIAHLYDFIPTNMPYSVYIFIRTSLSLLRLNILANTDDIETLAILLYWFVTSILFAVFVQTAKGWIRPRARGWLAARLGAASVIGGWFVACGAFAFAYDPARAFASPDPERAVNVALVGYWAWATFAVCAVLIVCRRVANRA